MAHPIVFIPGLNCTARLFDSQADVFGAERTIVHANQRRHDSLAGMAAAILDEAPGRFVLAGLSMGGYVSFEIMRRAPERVAGLVLMDTTARPDTDEAKERRRRQIEIAEAGRFVDIPPLQLPNLIPPERLTDEGLVATIRGMAFATGPDAFVRQQRAIMERPDSRPGLASITCPTLVIVGDRDLLTPPEVAEEIAAGIGGARLARMPACGHLSTLERPAAVNHALGEFLTQHDL